MAKRGLRYKLLRAFLLQIGLISIATLFGVLAAAKVVEDLLVRTALEGEAAHFWNLYQKNSDQPRPDTMNLAGYLAVDNDFSEVPESLRRLQPGYVRTQLDGRHPIVYVEDRNNARLFLVFDEEQVAELSFFFGVVPLSLVLGLIYLFAWLSYRQASQAVSPVVKLARKVDRFDLRTQRIAELDLSELRESTDSEVIILVDALDQFTERLQLFIERERNFTRDASHELRTPLTVIKSSLALLQKRPDYQPAEAKALDMIERTVRDMEALIDTLLLLAREESSPLPEDDILVNDLLTNLVEQIGRTAGNGRVHLDMEENCLLSVRAPEKVLTILFSNLLRNAFNYTHEGLISVTIDERRVSVADSGPGIGREQLHSVFEPFYRGRTDSNGHGLGLAIVKRLCNRFGWSLKVRSKPGEGTCFTVVFPKAHRIGEKKGASE